MPVIIITVNQPAEHEKKLQLLQRVTQVFAAECKVPAGHVHVHVTDSACFSYGGDTTAPGAYVTVKSSALQIIPESRKQLVVELMPLLSACFPGLVPERVTTFFEDFPVENIAVGANIALFAKSPTATGRASFGGGARPSAGGMPPLRV